MAVDGVPRNVVPVHAYYIFGTIYTVIFLLSISLNGFALHVFITAKTLNKFTKIIIGSVCLADFLADLFGLPLIIISHFCRSWVFGKSGCIYYGWLVNCLALSQVALLTNISILGYISVVKRTHKRKGTFSYNFIKWMVTSSYIAGFCMSLPPFCGWGGYELEGMRISCSPDQGGSNMGAISYNAFLVIVSYILPIAIISVSYIMIYKQTANIAFAERRKIRQRKITSTIFLMMVLFFVSWTPYAAIRVWSIFGQSEYINPIVGSLPHLFVKLSVSWVPIIYFFNNKEFSEACRSRIPLFKILSDNRIASIPPLPQNAFPDAAVPALIPRDTMGHM